MHIFLKKYIICLENFGYSYLLMESFICSCRKTLFYCTYCFCSFRKQYMDTYQSEEKIKISHNFLINTHVSQRNQKQEIPTPMAHKHESILILKFSCILIASLWACMMHSSTFHFSVEIAFINVLVLTTC